MLRAGIVGLPNVGKSTLFNAITRTRNAEAANYPFCTIDPNVGIVSVPDARLGKRLRKKELLSEIQRERNALDDSLALLSPGQMTKAGVTRGGWSVKDVLAHLVEWQQMNLDWYAAGLRGEKPATPAPGFTLRELPRLNEMIYRKHHPRSLQAVMHDYRSYHERVVELIEALSDADLVTLRRFSWTGPSWTLSDYLRASTAAHYLWARTRIRRWWRAQEKDKRRPAK